MKRSAIFVWILTLMWPGLIHAFAEKQANAAVNYYRVDKVKSIRGEIIKVNTEKCYDQKDYTVIYLREKKSAAVFRVEVSPHWFFEMDLMVGSRIEVTGSVNKSGNMNNIMTRSIMYRGEIFQFRDKHGFPLWRGKSGQGKRHGYGQGRRNRGKRGTF